MDLATKNLTFLFSRKDISSGTPPQGKTKQNKLPPPKRPPKTKTKEKKEKVNYAGRKGRKGMKERREEKRQ